MVKLLCNQGDTATFAQGIQQSSCSDPLSPVPVSVRHSWFKHQRTFTCLLLRADHLSALGLTAQGRHSCTLHSGLSVSNPSLSISKWGTPEEWKLKRSMATLRSPQMTVGASLPHNACRSHQCLSQAPPCSGPWMPPEAGLMLAAFQEE